LYRSDPVTFSSSSTRPPPLLRLKITNTRQKKMLLKINRKTPSLKLTIKQHKLEKRVRPIVRNINEPTFKIVRWFKMQSKTNVEECLQD
jgi:hypothetical protein